MMTVTPYRILVVDDEPINLLVARSILAKRGFAVLTADDGESGVAAVVASPIDLVLMDLRMPMMDGFQALAAIRRWEALAGVRLPVVALTAQGGEEARRSCLDAGFDAFLMKPVSALELMGTVESLLLPPA